MKNECPLTSFEQRYVFINGLQHSLLSRCLDTPSTEVVLCLHGWQDNAASFIPMLPHLSSFDLHLYEFVGHGLSDHKHQDSYYHFVDYVDDVLRIIELLNCERVHLVGHSMGGMIASLVAAVAPDKIASLVLLEASGPMVESTNALVQLKSGITARRVTQKVKRHNTLDALIKTRMFHGQHAYSNASLLVERDVIKRDEYWVRRSDHRLKMPSLVRLSEAQAMSCIDGILAPTIIILGDDGYEWLKEQTQQRMPHFKSVVLSIQPGNHHLHMTHPKETALTLSQFIQGLT